MSLRKPLVVNDQGEISQLPSGDLLDGAARIQFDNSTNGFTASNVQTAIEEIANIAIYSGKSIIRAGETLFIAQDFQSINFLGLTLEGELILDGDLWLA